MKHSLRKSLHPAGDGENMNTILVQMADTKWTTAAVRAACELAREQNADIVLAKMLHDSFLDWRGMKPEEYEFSETECDDLQAYQSIALAHGIVIRSINVRYEDLAEGLAEAADRVNATSVIATIPHSAIPFVDARTIHHFDAVLEAHQHQLFVVEQPAACGSDWQPHAHALQHN